MTKNRAIPSFSNRLNTIPMFGLPKIHTNIHRITAIFCTWNTPSCMEILNCQKFHIQLTNDETVIRTKEEKWLTTNSIVSFGKLHLFNEMSEFNVVISLFFYYSVNSKRTRGKNTSFEILNNFLCSVNCYPIIQPAMHLWVTGSVTELIAWHTNVSSLCGILHEFLSTCVFGFYGKLAQTTHNAGSDEFHLRIVSVCFFRVWMMNSVQTGFKWCFVDSWNTSTLRLQVNVLQ